MGGKVEHATRARPYCLGKRRCDHGIGEKEYCSPTREWIAPNTPHNKETDASSEVPDFTTRVGDLGKADGQRGGNACVGKNQQKGPYRDPGPVRVGKQLAADTARKPEAVKKNGNEFQNTAKDSGRKYAKRCQALFRQPRPVSARTKCRTPGKKGQGLF